MAIKRLSKTYRKAMAILAVGALAVVSFWILDRQGLSTGDDLGYMFTDAKLHGGDGHIVESLRDIADTQASHYFTTNGRVIVHALTQWFNAIGGRGLFFVVNSVMFGLLWLLLLLWTTGSERLRKASTSQALNLAIIAWVACWIATPYPGVTALSLTAYAINYVWGAVASLGFLLIYRRKPLIFGSLAESRTLFALIAIIIGSLQESFSLPIAGALILIAIFDRRSFDSYRQWLLAGYLIGAIITVAAPGNFARAAGGFSVNALMAKWESLGMETLFSPISALIVIIAVQTARRRMRWMRYRLELLIVLLSLMLAALTFTGVRQLTCASVFATIVIVRMMLSSRLWTIVGSRWTTAVLSLYLCLTLVPGYIVRTTAKTRYDSAVEMVKEQKRSIYPTSPLEAPYNTRNAAYWLGTRFNDDPFEGRGLQILYERYTKEALGRLYSHDHNKGHIISVSPSQPAVVAAASRYSTMVNDTTYATAPLDHRYRCFSIVNDHKTRRVANSKLRRIGFERVFIGDTIHYIVPSSVDTVIIRQL